MIKEVLILTIKKREIPFYYFKYLYRKDAIDYLDHLSLKEQIKIQTHPTIHKAEYYNVINNKLLFSVLSEKLSLKAPELLSFILVHDKNIIH